VPSPANADLGPQERKLLAGGFQLGPGRGEPGLDIPRTQARQMLEELRSVASSLRAGLKAVHSRAELVSLLQRRPLPAHLKRWWDGEDQLSWPTLPAQKTAPRVNIDANAGQVLGSKDPAIGRHGPAADPHPVENVDVARNLEDSF